jgi:putative SOS response-associated peptidase YedK
MCGRYAFGDLQKVHERYKLSNKLIGWGSSFNISPGTINPVVVANSPKRVILMKWGLVPFWAKDPRIGLRMINARSEEIFQKPAFRKPIRGQRCLVPASGFYEWMEVNLEERKEKYPFYITLKNQKVFSMAGVYDVWKDAEGHELFSYAIITTNANKVMSKIHERMPVILKSEDEDLYLSKDTTFEKLQKLFEPYDPSLMDSWPISKEVNNPRNDNSKLIEKVEGII